MVCAPVRRDNPRAKARGLSLRTGAQTLPYLSLIFLFLILSFVRARQGNVLQGTQSSVKLAVLLISVTVPAAELTVT